MHIRQSTLAVQKVSLFLIHSIILTRVCNSDRLDPTITAVYALRCEKTGFLFFDLVRHKPGCTAIEDGGLKSRDYCEADLRLCFRICKKPVFSRRGSYSIHFVT